MIDYAVNLDKKTSKRDFQEAFPETSPDLIALLESLLLVNPYYRFSATESIKSKIFDQCRIKAQEASAPQKFILDIDRDDAFNYEIGKSEKYDLETYR